jgi:hypothetical protein
MVRKANQSSRRFERFRARQFGIDCFISGQEKTSLRDISIGGAGVCSAKPLEVGSRCVLSIGTSKGKFDIPAEVVWSECNHLPICFDSRFPASMGLSFDREFIELSKDLVFELLN